MKHLTSLWRDEFVTNAPLRYDEPAVAARYLLPILCTAWGYDRDLFFKPEAVFGISPGEDEQTSRTEHFLIEGLRECLRSERRLTLDGGPEVFLVRPRLEGSELATARRRAVECSREQPDRVVVLTSFSVTDVYAGGELVRQYGLADWEKRPEELGEIFLGHPRQPLEPLDEAAMRSRLVETLGDPLSALAEEFALPRNARVIEGLGKSPAMAAAQCISYLCFLRFIEDRYPFFRTHLRRFYYAYSGEDEAYGDTGLSGQIWVDLNRLIRNMGQGPVLDTYLGYKFPDRQLRHKLWRPLAVSNDAMMRVLAGMVEERFGELRAPLFGEVLGQLVCDAGVDSAQTTLRLTTPEQEVELDLPDVADRLASYVSGVLMTAYDARDEDAFRTGMDVLGQWRFHECHVAGPVLFGQLVRQLWNTYRYLDELRMGWVREAASSGRLFDGITPEMLGHYYNGLWDMVKSQLAGEYTDGVYAELAELAVNVLCVANADEAKTYPAALASLGLGRGDGLLVGLPERGKDQGDGETFPVGNE